MNSTNTENSLNRILVVADCSNFEYVCINSSVKYWKEKYGDEARTVLKDPEETDQDNLPNLLNSESFRRVLSKNVQMKLEGLEWIVRNNHASELMLSEGMDIVFTTDDKLNNNFRRKIYPEYKAQRKLVRKQYDVFVLKDYIRDVVFKDLDIESRGYKIVGVKDCESDDIIAVLMNRFKDYFCRILISSDHDFLQLENVNQYDMFGNRITCGFKRGQDFIEMTPKKYLLWKIIKGDVADNIKNIAPGLGDVKAYRLSQDTERLKKMLTESQDVARNYKMNRDLIDFSRIPKDVEDRIYETLSNALKDSLVQKEEERFDLNGCMIL